MSMGAIYQILQRHLVHGTVRPGDEIGVRVDQLLTQDGIGTMMFLHLSKMGHSRDSGKFGCCYVDHDIALNTPQSVETYRFLQTACARFKVHLSKPGNGIGPEIHVQQFAAPGQLTLGAGCHMTTLGGLGTLAFSVGALELAVALTGAPYYCFCPPVIKVNLRGALRPWCSAKDVILHLIGRMSASKQLHAALEFTGKGVPSLTVADRSTIASLGEELGVVTSLFPADEVTRAYLAAHGRARDFKRISTGEGTDYSEEIEVDLAKIVPMAALPHGPERIVLVRELSGKAVHQVMIGGCVNGTYEDLARVASMLRGRKIHPEMQLLVAPSCHLVLRNLLEQGLLQDILTAGGRLIEPTCQAGFLRSPVSLGEWVTVRTSGPNTVGRAGPLGAEIVLSSPETAAATALRGCITDPRELKLPAPKIKMAKRLISDDHFILFPPRKGKTEIAKGSSLIEPPRFDALPISLAGEAVLKIGDNLSTEQILPASDSPRVHSNIREYARHLFERIDPLFLRRAVENMGREICNIIIAGHGYGQGGNQEYVALCQMILGIRVIMGKSFDKLQTSQLIHQGILPLTFLEDRAYELVHRDDFLEFPWVAAELKKSEMITVRNPEKGYEFKVRHGLTRRQIDILLVGGLANYISG